MIWRILRFLLSQWYGVRRIFVDWMRRLNRLSRQIWLSSGDRVSLPTCCTREYATSRDEKAKCENFARQSDNRTCSLYTSRTRRTLSETGNVRRTDFRFTRRVTVMRDDLHREDVSRRVIYRLTFTFIVTCALSPRGRLAYFTF